MSGISFNVLSESWIPVKDLNGRFREVGITECLLNAHNYQEVLDSSPIIEFGIYRLLLAFVIDSLNESDQFPEDHYDILDLLSKGCFKRDSINEYIDLCGNVFDLFDPCNPFLQTIIPADDFKSASNLSPDVPSGTNSTIWYHGNEQDFNIDAKTAARWLTVLSPFAIAGGRGLSPSINGAPPIYVLPRGKNLFETLIMNIPLRSKPTKGQSAVAWRRDDMPGKERNQASILEALTWRPRRIQLVPVLSVDGKVVIKRIKFEEGDRTRLEWIDPNIAYIYRKDKVSPVRMKENRPLWRDAGPLLLLNDELAKTAGKDSGYSRPDVIELSFKLFDEASELNVNLYGMRTDNAKVFEWMKSYLSVPSKLGRNTRLGSLVHEEIELASSIARDLRYAIKLIYPRKGEKAKSPFETLIIRTERMYWFKMETEFDSLMSWFNDLPHDAPDNPELIRKARANWREAMKNNAQEQFAIATEDMDTDSEIIMRRVNAENYLFKKLRRIADEK